MTEPVRAQTLNLEDGEAVAREYPQGEVGFHCGRDGHFPHAHFVCTRLAHIEGPHVAHAGGRAVAWWPR